MRLKSFVILAALIFAVSPVSAQDGNAPDSLKLFATSLSVDSVTQSFEVACSTFVDSAQLGLLQFGWRWTTNSATLTMDSAVPSADFDAMELGPFFFLNESLATTNDSQAAFASAVGIVNLFPSSPSWQYVCTYYMTMTNWSGLSSLTIDTVQILPGFGSTEYLFQPPGGGIAYQPVWGGPINIIASAVEEVIPGTLPTSFQLNQNFPNPFNPSTTISFDLPTRSKVTLTVFNLLGQKVSTLVDKDLTANSYKVEWDGRSDTGESVASGIYFYKLIAEAEDNEFVETKKMMLLK